MSELNEGQAPRLSSAIAARTALFFCFWLPISGWKAADLPVGLAAAIAAAWASVTLRPEKGGWPRLGALASLTLHFLRGSVIAGFDVATRALRRDLDLNPGFQTAPLTLPPGTARNAFCALASLAPGSLPVGIEGDKLILHCLDVDQPVARDLGVQEALFKRTLRDE